MGRIWLKTKYDNGMQMEIPHNHNMANAMYGLPSIQYAKLISARWAQLLEREDEFNF